MDKGILQIDIAKMEARIKIMSLSLDEKKKELSDLNRPDSEKWAVSRRNSIESPKTLNDELIAAHEAGQKYGAKKEAEKYIALTDAARSTTKLLRSSGNTYMAITLEHIIETLNNA